MSLHYRSTNYNPQIVFGVYSAAASSVHIHRAEASFSRRECEHNAFAIPRYAACVLSKHVSAETIVYNVSEESNLLALGLLVQCVRLEKNVRERERERERKRKGQVNRW